MDLEEYFGETLFLKNSNECGIFNLDSSSGDGTHCVMSFKKCKKKFYVDSYGVQPSSVVIENLKSPIFDNNERSRQNGEVF